MLSPKHATLCRSVSSPTVDSQPDACPVELLCSHDFEQATDGGVDAVNGRLFGNKEKTKCVT